MSSMMGRFMTLLYTNVYVIQFFFLFIVIGGWIVILIDIYLVFHPFFEIWSMRDKKNPRHSFHGLMYRFSCRLCCPLDYLDSIRI